MTEENDIIISEENASAGDINDIEAENAKSYPPGLSPDVAVDSRELAEKIVRILAGR